MKVLFAIYDNGSYDHVFPMGAGAIAAVLKKEGHETHIWNQDMHHYKDEKLTEELDKGKYDVVIMSLIAGYYQYRKLIGLSKAINNSKFRPTYLLGGYGPTPEPEFFINKTGCDIVCLGEGEITAVKLLKCLEDGGSLHEVPGIVWKDEKGNFHKTNRPPQVEDLDSLPWYPYEIFPMNYYRLMRTPNAETTDFSMPMMSARGCSFKCTFCYRMDTGYRKRDASNLLDEVEMLHKDYGINRISFQDDLLMSSVDHTVEVCNEFLKRKINVKWDCNGRLNYCSPELLNLMKKSGCVFINYGIEAIDQKVLNGMKKGLTEKIIVKGIEATLDEGISPGLNFIWGNLFDTKKSLKKTVDFLIKYDDFAQKRTIRPVTPYPGSPLYHTAIKMGLLDKDNPAEDFYENKHLNSDLLACNFTNLSEDQFYDALKKANQRLMKNYFTSQMESTLESIEYLYDEKDVTFRGFRHSGVDGLVGNTESKAQIKCEHNHQGPEVNWESSVTTDGDRFKSNKIYNSNKYMPKPPKYDFDKFYSRLISKKEFKNQLNFLDN